MWRDQYGPGQRRRHDVWRNFGYENSYENNVCLSDYDGVGPFTFDLMSMSAYYRKQGGWRSIAVGRFGPGARPRRPELDARGPLA